MTQEQVSEGKGMRLGEREWAMREGEKTRDGQGRGGVKRGGA